MKKKDLIALDSIETTEKLVKALTKDNVKAFKRLWSVERSARQWQEIAFLALTQWVSEAHMFQGIVQEAIDNDLRCIGPDGAWYCLEGLRGDVETYGESCLPEMAVKA